MRAQLVDVGHAGLDGVSGEGGLGGAHGPGFAPPLAFGIRGEAPDRCRALDVGESGGAHPRLEHARGVGLSAVVARHVVVDAQPLGRAREGPGTRSLPRSRRRGPRAGRRASARAAPRSAHRRAARGAGVSGARARRRRCRRRRAVRRRRRPGSRRWPGRCRCRGHAPARRSRARRRRRPPGPG